MDEHARPTPTSSSSPPSMASFISAAGNGNLVLEFPYSEVPEQWLMMDNDDSVQQQPPEHAAAAWQGDGGSLSSASADELFGNDPPVAAAAATRRGRKPAAGRSGSRSNAFSHVQSERNRRDKLHRLFCDLRAAVPSVSRMDKASILADAAAYIFRLRARVEQLEAEAAAAAAAAAQKAHPSDSVHDAAAAPGGGELEEELEVRMVVGQRAAALRLTTTSAARHAPARLMDALRSLDLPVQHACVCRVGGVTVQDAVVDVPAELRDEGRLCAALLQQLQHSG